MPAGITLEFSVPYQWEKVSPVFASPKVAPQLWEPVSGIADSSQTSWQALEKLKEFQELPENWDGYGSRSIQPAALHQAARLVELLSKYTLPPLQIFPVPGGGLQFEWQTATCGAELEFLPDGTMQYLIEDAQGEMREGEVSASDLEVYRLIRWLTSQNLSIASF